MADSRLEATVRGMVQGVGFRASARRAANRLSVTGWVRNEPDGSVFTVAEGEPPALEDYLAFLHEGPASARVTDVASEWKEATGEFNGFTIRYH
ncbi:MAG: acylphosphatase [Chloroflexi bacterium]|nr:acylphosphatase [Chloroflexota bacterium]